MFGHGQVKQNQNTIEVSLEPNLLEGRKEKRENRQLWDLNPGCLTVAA